MQQPELKLYQTYYCIDASALIDLKPLLYYQVIFPSIWRDLEQFILQDRLIAPNEVLKELEQYAREDVILKWAREKIRMFKELDANK